MSSLLARSIGRLLSSIQDLNLIEIESAIDVDPSKSRQFAAEIVREINSVIPADSGYPKSVLLVAKDVFSQAQSEFPDVTVVNPASVLKFRFGNRIVVQTCDVISASVKQSFKLGVSREFPYPQKESHLQQQHMLSDLAKISLELVLEQSVPSINAGAFLNDENWIIDSLNEVLEILRESYGKLHKANGILKPEVVPQALWTNHVDKGLHSLCASLADRKLKAEDRLEIIEFFATGLWAPFSLPRPEDLRTRRFLPKNARRHWEVCKDHWATAELVSETLSNIAICHRNGVDDPHPIEELEWDDLDRFAQNTQFRTVGPLFAFTQVDSALVRRHELFSQLTERNFFGPWSTAPVDPVEISITMRLRHLDGVPLSESSAFGGVKFIGSFVSSEQLEFSTPDFEIVLSGGDSAEALKTAAQDARVVLFDEDNLFSIRHGIFTQDAESGEMVASARIFKQITQPVLLSNPVLMMKVLYGSGKDDFQRKATQQQRIIVTPPDGAVLYCSEIPEARRGAVKIQWVGSKNFDIAGKALDGDEFEIELRSERIHSLIVWAKNLDEAPSLNGVLLEQVDLSEDLWSKVRYRPEDEGVLRADAYRFRLIVDELGEDPVHSPIIGAIEKRDISLNPTEIQVESLRGDIETLYGALITQNGAEPSLFHLVLPSEVPDAQVAVGSITTTANGSFLIPDVQEFGLNTNLRRMFERVPKELIQSLEMTEFLLAFKALGLDEELRKQCESGGLGWMSRVSVGHLHESDQLNRYLESFTALIGRANQIGEPWGQFWATYPFSASVWSTTPVPKCSTVFLSPFHPIRLAWLASVEAHFKPVATKRARRLALGVEGWNFPMFGPTEVAGVKCLAVPSDPGADYEFAGWSQLLRCEGSLNSPTQICGRRTPSSSAVAISEASVQSAFSVFRRIHPYLSSLRIDLADERPVNRATGVDRQVLNAALIDGLSLEVLDSTLREGEVPQFPSDFSEDIRVTWRRYDPMVKGERPTRVHIRILQDPNISVRLDPSNLGSKNQRGVVSGAPLRRFAVARSRDANFSEVESYLDPSLYAGHSASPFVTALDAVELSGSQPQVQSIAVQLPINGGLVSNSFLTVFGESHISPSAVARLFREDRENPMMIWEWSAPFRSDVVKFGGRSIIDSRSHYSIARVPQRFKEEVKTLLSSLIDSEPSIADVDRLLGVLGTRGVSLANLLASGETQALSALGFYVAYELADCIWNPEAPTFVLPLDVCQGFIATLLNSTQGELSGKRSDLVMISVSANTISFRVVELKYIGAKNPLARLPEVGSGDPNLQKGREQLRDVNELFERILIEWNQLRVTAEDVSSSQDDRDTAKFELGLMGNTLAMLLEAGMKTNSNGAGNVELALKGLENLANSSCDLHLETPLLLGLYSLSIPDPHARIGTTQFGESFSVTEFIADSRALFSQIDSQSGPAFTSWKGLFASTEAYDRESAVEPDADHRELLSVDQPAEISDLFPAPKSSPDINIQDSTVLPEPIKHDGQQNSSAPVPVEPEMPAPNDILNTTAEVPSPLAAANSDTETKESLVDGDGIRIVVGQRLSVPNGPPIDFWPSNTRLNQFNVGVIGDLGTGKTQLLQGLVYQIRKQGDLRQKIPVSGLILDYKRDYQTDQFLGAVDGHSLEPVNLPLDLFRVDPIDGRRALRACQQRAREFADVVGKIYNIGGKQRSTLTNVVRELIQSQKLSPTMAQVLEAYLQAVDQEPDLVSAVLESFVYGEVFSEDPTKLKTMAELLDGRVVVFNLSALGADQQLKNALVALFLNEYFSYMLKLPKWKPVHIGDNQFRIINSILLVDEATNIMQYEFDVLTQILQQGREFGVGVLLSSQYLTHFDTTNVNYKEPLRTWFIHKVPQVKQKELQSIGVPAATTEDAARVSSLENHQAYFVSLDFNGVFIKGTPFYQMLQSESDAKTV